MAEQKKRGRPKNLLPVVTIQLTVNTTLAAEIDRIVQTGLFGESRADCAERLIAERLRSLIREGVLPKAEK